MTETNWIEKAKKHLRELDTHQRKREAAVIMAGLVEQNGLMRGAMDAQDEREQQAGEKCGISYLLHGCGWPDAVADELVFANREISRLLDGVEHNGMPEVQDAD